MSMTTSNDGLSRRGTSGQRSVLASDLRINGIVATEGALELHGVLEGEVAATTILVGHEGQVTGSIRAGNAELRGKVSGEIFCDTLVIRSAATSEADATCETLVIEAGASVEGRFARPEPAEPEPAPAPARSTTTPPADAAAPAADGGTTPPKPDDKG